MRRWARIAVFRVGSLMIRAGSYLVKSIHRREEREAAPTVDADESSRPGQRRA